MNLSNDDALDVMVAIGRQALERGKVDQALTIFSGVLSKAPHHALAAFSLGRAHLLKGCPDHAALCYHRAGTLASRQPKGAPPGLARSCRDNAVLCGERVLPRDWLPALQDPHHAECWATALHQLAATAAAEAGAPDTQPPSPSSLSAFVVGGLGLQALYLHGLLTAAAGAPPASPPAGVCVTWVQRDELSRTLGAQMAAAAGVPPGELRAVNGWPAPPSHEQGMQQLAVGVAEREGSRDGGNGGGDCSGSQLLVAAGACGARLALGDWAEALAKARPHLAPGAALCPASARLVGMLVASEDLRALNEVRCDWMEADSGGLQYGPANELLWRPARSVQVSSFRYTPLSEPFPLLPELRAQQLLTAPEAVLGGGSSGPSGAVGGGTMRHEVVATARGSGAADCVVAWMEYELAPGVWLSYAPHEVQGRPDPPALCPHIWQRVQYLSARPALQAGQQIVLQVTLSGNGNDLRVEYDEDVDAIRRCQAATGGGAGASSAEGDGQPEDPGAASGLPAGEPLLPAGEALDSDSESDGGDTSNAGGDRAASGIKAGGSVQQAATAAAAAAGGGQLLPYHMSMLNDRLRTRAYARGIRAAVSEAAERARQSGSPLLVLDVGAGSGLLSMMAAGAGAEAVVGVERELALAVTAGALVGANGLSDRVRVLQAHSANVKVADDATKDKREPAAVAAAAAAAAGETAASAAAAEGKEAQQERGPAGGDAQGGSPDPRVLPRRAGLVVHEIFGTDPLSEQLLPSMAQVQASLAAPDALYVPSAFRIVAALAHSSLLEERMRAVRPPLGAAAGTGTGPAAEAEAGEAGAGSGGAEAEVAARLARVLPAAAGAALQAWAPWKAELDLLRVPDLVLLSEPAVVSALSLQDASRPLPRAYKDSALVTPCDPTPLAARFARHGPDGEPLTKAEPAAAPAAASAGDGGSAASANCVVYWFEADCGPGGWLSTYPGSGSTYFGHWAQNVQFLSEPLPALRPGEAAAGGVALRLSAECVLDRVRLEAEWVMAGEESGSGSGSESESEGEAR